MPLTATSDQKEFTQAEPTASSGLRLDLDTVWRARLFARPLSIALFVLVLAGLCWVRAYIGLLGPRFFNHDVFMVLDGAWRMLNAQRPHVDFNSMVGPVAYAPAVLGLALTHGYVSGFGYGQAIFGFLIGIWAFALGSRLSDVPRAVFSLLVTILAVAPSNIGPSPLIISGGMTYNRYTYALLGLLLVECLQPRGRSEFREGFSSGAVLGLLAFLKITGIIVGGLMIIALIPVRDQTRRRWAGVALGLLITIFAISSYLHFRLDLVFRDIALTVGAKHIHTTDLYDLDTIALQAAVFALLAVGTSAYLRQLGRNQLARRTFIAAVAILLASFLLIFGNFQVSELPLTTLLLVVWIDYLIKLPGGTAPDDRVARSMLLAGVSLLVFLSFTSLGLTYLTGLYLRRSALRTDHPFDAAPLARFIPHNEEAGYTLYANEGIHLLREYRHPGEHIMSLDFANPFELAFLVPPAPGGSTNLQYRGSFSDTHRLTPQQLFGAYELVMLPKYYSDTTLPSAIPAFYGPYLKQHYALVAQTEWWQLYRRVGPLDNPAPFGQK